jgi:hypothetical protein
MRYLGTEPSQCLAEDEKKVTDFTLKFIMGSVKNWVDQSASAKVDLSVDCCLYHDERKEGNIQLHW